MKKIVLLILFISFAVSAAYCLTVAGPKSFQTETFGVSEGMTLKELTEKCKTGGEPKSLTNDDRYIFVPKQNDSIFKIYIAFVDQKKGLYGTRIVTGEITPEENGISLEAIFYQMIKQMSDNLGTPMIRDTKIKKYPYPEDNSYYRYSLGSNVTKLSATWKKGEETVTLPEEIERVSMYCLISKNGKTGYIIFENYYLNSIEILEEQDKTLE